ncbi:MAG: hypothetical protein OER95_12555 [Acidimicrobiia bacterium]|nr:hypothetical protein [Acidimicrobiia bacterium]
MVVPLIIALVLAAAFLVLWLTAQSKGSALAAERDGVQADLDQTAAMLSTRDGELNQARSQISILEAKVAAVDGDLDDTRSKLTDATDALRKRTELADAQALQIDALSGERDELRRQLGDAEERLVTMAARPGVVVGEMTSSDDGTPEANAKVLWALELARSERQWRNSVAIDPLSETSPFEATDDPAREAVEIESAALREDVGALIKVDWQAPPIEAPARRLMIVRIAQEMLATAARVPGAARLLVTQEESGALKMEFVSAEEGEVINLIPPQISSDLIDVRNDTGLSVTVRAE